MGRKIRLTASLRAGEGRRSLLESPTAAVAQP